MIMALKDTISSVTLGEVNTSWAAYLFGDVGKVRVLYEYGFEGFYYVFGVYKEGFIDIVYVWVRRTTQQNSFIFISANKASSSLRTAS
jgi:hypothetical protein